MHSIQTKFITMIAIALLTLSLLLGGYATIMANRIAIKDSALMLNSVCNEQMVKMNTDLNQVEQSVTIIYNYAKKMLPSVESLADKDYCEEYLSMMQTFALDVAEITKLARTVYFRINPEITDPMEGFYLINPNEDGVFYENQITDVLAYDRKDVSHVGWFYQPIDAGKPIWMSPYYNENINLEIISYVIPFYFDEKLVGVIGMDIAFSRFVDMASEAKEYDNSFANLIDMEHRQIYYHDGEEGEVLAQPITERLWDVLSVSDSNREELVSISAKKHSESYVLVFRTTQNGMKYVLFCNSKEINSARNQLILGIVSMTIGSLIFFIILTTGMTRRIIRPLSELTSATKKLAEGDWDVEISCATKDEVKVLTDSIITMATDLKKYVSEVNGLAFKDGLTGVKNKNCYNDYIQMLQQGNVREYAVVTFDVNDLKAINDNYGHLAGDTLITAACTYICKTFSHSPVFRTGGDEFVAILEGEDYNDREKLLQKFEEGMSQNLLPVEPFSPIYIAYGMAEFSNEFPTYEEVFEKADSKMYDKKKMMKQQYK